MSVTTASAMPAPVTRDRRADRRLIRIWLYAIALLVVAMVMVGGATRLTHSGLSITEWQPIHGVIPPLNDAEWQEEFSKYQQIPEFKAFNQSMTVSEFKGIFYWEWSHRLLGRLVGFVFVLPLLFFWATGRIEKSLRPQLVVIFLLGGLQGAVGWWMVSSGLVELTDVSQYRLATHLILACIILAYTIWVARSLVPARPNATYPAAGTKAFAAAFIALVFIQIYLGALVAGLDAGFMNNDWPTMGGALVPPDLMSHEPAWRNFFENPVTVQFMHRIVAYLVLIAVLWHAFRLSQTAPGSRAAWSAYRLTALVLVQVVIGIATLMAVVPISLGLIHQLVAVIVLIGAVAHRRAMSPPIPVTG